MASRESAPGRPEEARSFSRLMAVVERDLAAAELSWYPAPELVQDEVNSYRAINIGDGSGGYSGVRLSERTYYARSVKPKWWNFFRRLTPLVFEYDEARDTKYVQADPEVLSKKFSLDRRELVVYAWKLGTNPHAATDFGAWQEQRIWSVSITPELDDETSVAIAELLEGETTAHDPRFDRYKTES